MASRTVLSNPFPGLRSFNADEGGLFFGRDNQKTELLRRLKRNRLVAVVGTSGSGKSSLIRAGLIPSLQRGFRTRAGSDWCIVVMRPGNNPIGRLALALHQGLGQEQQDADMALTMTETSLRRSAMGLLEVVRQGRVAGNVLILVDQFEELFRVQPDPDYPEDQAAAFVRLLLEAVEQQQQPIYIVLTMRSDYLGDCARFAGLPEAINKGQYLIPRLTREQRRQVIVGPIQLRGVEIAPRLLHRLLNDVGDNPDQLPILQHALLRTWDYWQTHSSPEQPLDLLHYEAIGTMAEALERHADEAYHELDAAGRIIAEKLFRRLTERGSDHRDSRHPSVLRDLCEVSAAEPAAVIEVVDRFRRKGRSFLLPGPEQPLTADTVLDISHESLIRVWGRLRRWADKEARAAEDYLRLVERMSRYHQGKDTYLSNPALQFALDRRRENQPNQAWARRYDARFNEAMAFLDASLVEHEKQEAEKEAARQRELEQARALAEEQQRRLQEQQRATRRMRWFTIALSLVFVMAVVFAVWAKVQGRLAAQAAEEAKVQRRLAESAAADAMAQSKRAEKQARLSKARELAMAAINNLSMDPDLSTLLALQAVAVTYKAEDGVTFEAHNALNRAVQAEKNRPILAGHDKAVIQVAFTPDGKRMLSAGQEGSIRIWDMQTLKTVSTLGNPGQMLSDMALSPAGARIAAATTVGTVQVWDLDGTLLYRLQAHQGAITDVVFSPDGRVLASAAQDADIRLWDALSGQLLYTLKAHQATVAALVFSPDGSRLASAGWDGKLRLWDPRSGRLLDGLEAGHGAAVTSLVFSPDGSRLASAGWDGMVKLWDPVSGRLIKNLSGHKAVVMVLAFSPDSALLASAGWDRMVKLWDPVSGRFLRTLRGHRAAVTQLAFSPAGKHLASAGWGATIRLWELSTGLVWRRQSSHKDWINALAFSPDGIRLASGGDDKIVVLWKVQVDQASQRLSGYQDWQEGFAFSEGRMAATEKGRVWIFDASTGQLLHHVTGTDIPVNKMAFSEDGARIAIAGIDDEVHDYYLDIAELIATAKRLLRRSFRPEECRIFMHEESCPFSEF